MAITAAVLTEGASLTDATSYVTASVSPAGNRLLLLTVCSGDAAGAAALAPSSVTGNGLTWVQVATQNDATNTNTTTTVLRAMGASPSAGAITIDFAATQENCMWQLAEFDGVETSGTEGSGAVVQSKTENDTTGAAWAITLDAAPNSANALFGGVCQNSSTSVISAGTGYTELGTQAGQNGPAMRRFTMWDDSAPVDGVIDGTAVGTAPMTGVGIEIALASVSANTSGSAGAQVGSSFTGAGAVSYGAGDS